MGIFILFFFKYRHTAIQVLGPLLFVLYINDLPDVMEYDSELYSYDDETKLYRQIKKKDDTKFFQENIICMRQWSDQWLLSFHPKKCKYMRIGRSEVSHGNYYVNEQFLEVEHEKDLGVIIDNRLNFSEHLNMKINMANKITGLIRRTFVSLDEMIFKQLYVALVRPH